MVHGPVGHVRGVDMGEMWAMVMCALRGLGSVWHMHEGHGQGRRSMVYGSGAEVVVLLVDRQREAQQIRQVAWLGAT